MAKLNDNAVAGGSHCAMITWECADLVYHLREPYDRKVKLKCVPLTGLLTCEARGMLVPLLGTF